MTIGKPSGSLREALANTRKASQEPLEAFGSNTPKWISRRNPRRIFLKAKTDFATDSATDSATENATEKLHPQYCSVDSQRARRDAISKYPRGVKPCCVTMVLLLKIQFGAATCTSWTHNACGCCLLDRISVAPWEREPHPPKENLAVAAATAASADIATIVAQLNLF